MALLYLCGSLNRFSKAHGSELAPCDVVLGRHTPKGSFTLLGATILAELPQSVRDLAPNMSRFVEAAFMHPVLSSQAIRVWSKDGTQDFRSTVNQGLCSVVLET